MSLVSTAAFAAAPASPPRVSIDAPSPYVTGEEFSRRLLSPIAADDMARFLQVQGRALAPEPFVAGAEQLDVFVPEAMPAAGYGLVVFVPPGDDFALPREWKAALERRGLLFVSLRNAGNDADVIGRRIPLVLHAHHLATTRFKVDPERVYVSGFSGGARLAQRVALAWPDVFTGSLQFAGSVVIGQSLMPPPPAELMTLFQQRTRVVMVSGNLDLPNRRNDAEARETMRHLCVAGERGFGPPRLDHWVPDGRSFTRALDMLEEPVVPAPASAEACRRELATEMDEAMDSALVDAAGGRQDAAVAKLVAVDDRYGGLAAPRLVEIARKIMADREAAAH